MIEVLVVMGVIGIILSAVLIGINPYAQIGKGQDGRRKSDLRQIQSALELFRTDNNSYPSTTTFPSSCPTQSPLIFGTTTYMQKVPCDPSTQANYSYTPSPPGCTEAGPTYCTSYILYGCLANEKDKDREVDDGTPTDRCLTLGAADGWVGFTLTNP